MSASPTPGALHHLEIWVPSLERAEGSLGWLLTRLGWSESDRWRDGVSYRLDSVYVVIEAGPDVVGSAHERTRPGLNHLALHAVPADELDDLVRECVARGWTLMYADRHPFAGGPEHRAAYLEDADGFEIELVALP